MADTLFERVWEAHVVSEPEGEAPLLYVDLHLVHEVTSAQAFEGLRLAGRPVRRPDLTLATMDHNVPTDDRPADDHGAAQLDALRRNCDEFGVRLYATGSGQGRGSCTSSARSSAYRSRDDDRLWRQPHVDARRARRTRVRDRYCRGRARARNADPASAQAQDDALEFRRLAPLGVTAKDVILGAIGDASAWRAGGHVIEYAARRGHPQPADGGRMTICNMSIEAGARQG